MDGDGGLEDAGSKRRTRRLAQTHLEIQDRLLSQPLKESAMRGLRRAVRRQTVVKCRRIELVEHGGGGGGDVTIKENGNAIVAGGQYRTGHRGKLAPAEPSQNLQGIFKMRAVQSERLVDGFRLALKPRRINAGARTDPVISPALIKGGANRSRDGGIAYSHFTDAQKIGAAGNRFHAEGHGLYALGLLQGGMFGDVARRHFEGQFKYLQAEAKSLAELVDGGSAGAKVGDHLRRHFLGISGDTMADDAVVSGEDDNDGPVDGGGMAPLPGGDKFSEFFETAERAQRLRERFVAPARSFGRRRVGPRQGFQKAAYVIKRQSRLCERHTFETPEADVNRQRCYTKIEGAKDSAKYVRR